jgi:hypothetical protein
MKRAILIVSSLLVFPHSYSAVSWTGNGDGLSFFQEANWEDSGTSLAPADGTINPGTSLNGGTSEDYVLTGVTLSQIGAGNIVLGNALTTITLDNSSVGLDFGVFRGINGAGIFNLTNGSTLSSQFVSESLVTNVDATSNLILNGGDAPINFSATINLEVGATLTFNNETVADASSEHFGDIFIGGSALSSLTEGVDYTHVSDGGTGSIITAIPEVSTLGLMTLAFSALALSMRSCPRKRGR